MLTFVSGHVRHGCSRPTHSSPSTPLDRTCLVQSQVLFSPTFPISNFVRVCHSILCVFPVDVINTHTHTHTPRLTLAGPRYVKGMSPPSAAENNQIILSGDTSSFRHGGDGASSPLLCLHLSASF